MFQACRDGQLDLSARAAEGNIVDAGILLRHLDRDRIDVGGGHARRGPQPQRGESEEAGAGAESENVGKVSDGGLEAIERHKAARGRLMLAGAEGAPDRKRVVEGTSV